MKKYLLATAIATICAAQTAMADNNLYGQFRASVNSIDDKNNGHDGMSVQDNVSLFGIKGSVGEDLKAFYHLQTGAPAGANGGNAFNQRFFFAGLEGGFGKVAYGRMTNAYKFAGFNMDPFYNLSHIGANGGFSAGLASYGLSGATNGFTDGSVQYTSPSLSGVKINLGIYLDPTKNEDEHGSGFGAVWSNKTANIGVQYAANGKNVTLPGIVADGSATRVYGGFKGDGFSVAASYEMLDKNAANSDETYMFLTGTFNMNAETRLVGTLGMVEEDATIKAKAGTGFTLGVFHDIVKNTEVYMSYSAASLDMANSEDPSVVSVGAIHKFGIGG